nr:hypothetical protein [Bacilli bacterium]
MKIRTKTLLATTLLCMVSLLPSVSAYAKTTTDASVVAPLLVQGSQLDMAKTFTLAGHQYEVITTKSSEQNQFRPWIIIGEKEASTWTPIYALHAGSGFATNEIVLGPSTKTQQALAISFILDGGTAIESEVYTINVSQQTANTVSILPLVIENSLKYDAKSNQLEINGLNFQDRVSYQKGQLTLQSIPDFQIAKLASKDPVYFVYDQGSKPAKDAIHLIGASSITRHVGDTISFVPLNRAAQKAMYGTMPLSNTGYGISVYTNGGSPIALGFYQAAQVLQNAFTFSQPGNYTFGIVPPYYMAMKPNQQVAILHVHVVR